MNKPTPYTAEQTSMYNLCKKLLETCDRETIEKYGAGELNNSPFEYCMYYQICGYELDFGRIGNPANHEMLVKFFDELAPMLSAMEVDVENALMRTGYCDG